MSAAQISQSSFVTWAYGTPSRFYLRMSDNTVEILMSERGVRQGCPLSPLLFSLVMRRIVVAIRALLRERVVAVGAFGVDDGPEPFLDSGLDAALVSAYLDDIMDVVRTAADGIRALEAALAAGALVGLEMHPGKSKTIDAPALFVNGGVIELLGGHVGGAAAVSAALVESVHDEPVLERLARWKDAGHTHLVLSLLRSCTMRSKSRTVRCERDFAGTRCARAPEAPPTVRHAPRDRGGEDPTCRS